MMVNARTPQKVKIVKYLIFQIRINLRSLSKQGHNHIVKLLASFVIVENETILLIFNHYVR